MQGIEETTVSSLVEELQRHFVVAFTVCILNVKRQRIELQKEATGYSSVQAGVLLVREHWLTIRWRPPGDQGGLALYKRRRPWSRG